MYSYKELHIDNYLPIIDYLDRFRTGCAGSCYVRVPQHKQENRSDAKQRKTDATHSFRVKLRWVDNPMPLACNNEA